MIRALIDGEDDPAELAELAKRRLRGKIPQLKLALHGRITEHHRFLLRVLLDQLAFLESLIVRYDARIEEVSARFAESMQLLQGVPGVATQAAEVIVAEIGTDMTTFPTHGHLSSWAGMCPGNNEMPVSGAVAKQAREVSGCGQRSCRWRGQPVTPRRQSSAPVTIDGPSGSGRKKALVALGHKILVVIYQLLKNHTEYQERWTPAKAI